MTRKQILEYVDQQEANASPQLTTVTFDNGLKPVVGYLLKENQLPALISSNR